MLRKWLTQSKLNVSIHKDPVCNAVSVIVLNRLDPEECIKINMISFTFCKQL